MEKAPIPPFEADRLCAVESLKILDTAAEERFDRLTREATAKFKVPISTITIVDRDREWFKSNQGLTQKEGPRDISFCGHALLKPTILILEDTLKDDRFADNPMVTGSPFIRFYAGKALEERGSHLPVGVFCIKDHKPHQMSTAEIADFLDLAKRAEDEVNLLISQPELVK
jgi:GAF domain-containing protein